MSAVDMRVPRVCPGPPTNVCARADCDSWLRNRKSYFSTDTGAVLRATNNADIVLMAKNIDGIYDRDPRVHPDAKKYDQVTYDEILSKSLPHMTYRHGLLRGKRH